MDAAVSQSEDVGVVRNSIMATSKHRTHRVSLARGTSSCELGYLSEAIRFKSVVYIVHSTQSACAWSRGQTNTLGIVELRCPHTVK